MMCIITCMYLICEIFVETFYKPNFDLTNLILIIYTVLLWYSVCPKNHNVTCWPVKITTYEEYCGLICAYLSSSLVVTSPIRLTVSIPPDTRPNIE